MTVTAVALFLAILALLWLLALELRFHSLKGVAGESEELANNALSTAETLFNKVEAELKAHKPAPKARKR